MSISIITRGYVTEQSGIATPKRIVYPLKIKIKNKRKIKIFINRKQGG